MIHADRKHLEATLRADTIGIRDKELSIFAANFSVLATLSSFLTGIGFSGLTMVPVWYSNLSGRHREHSEIIVCEVLYYALTSMCIGFNILTLCICVYSMIFGPALALRGPDGSMARAVEGMYTERKWAMRFYGLGLLNLLLAGVVLAWLKFGINSVEIVTVNTAVSICLVLAVFIVFILVYMRLIVRPRFKFPRDFARRPDNIIIGGMDPETGEQNTAKETDTRKAKGSSYSDNTTGQTTRSPQKSKNAALPSYMSSFASDSITASGTIDANPHSARRTSLMRSVRDINWMQEQGLITDQAAREKRDAAVDKMLALDKIGAQASLSSGAEARRAKPVSSRSFLGSFRSSSRSSSFGGMQKARSRDTSRSVKGDSTNYEGFLSSAVRSEMVLYNGKVGLLQADIEKLVLFDPRRQELRKRWLLTGNSITCTVRDGKIGGEAWSSLSQRIVRTVSSSSSADATAVGVDPRGPWFSFVVQIGKTQILLGAPSAAERHSWVEWFLERAANSTSTRTEAV